MLLVRPNLPAPCNALAGFHHMGLELIADISSSQYARTFTTLGYHQRRGGEPYGRFQDGVIALLFSVGAVIAVGGLARGGPPMQLTLISSAFSHQVSIPQRYTCEGDDISPPLAWSGAPAGTKSFVLVVDDPDARDPRAPRMT